MSVTIKTDHKWHDFRYRSEVPDDVLNDQFEHLSEDENPDGYFKYKGWWYHLSDFVGLDREQDWHGYASDSMFSGVYIKVSKDGERYMVATYTA